jgi:hypothetical protein
MRLDLYNRVPAQYDRQTFVKMFVDIQSQLNALSEGQLVGRYNAVSSVPTTGNYAVGDIVYNSTPSELGSASSKYILLAWLCTDDSPLTFRELRCLTGN